MFDPTVPLRATKPEPKDRHVAQEPSKSTRFKEAWVIFFILGVIMLNFPFIHIFNKNTTVLGFPLLILYFFGGWLISILVIYLFTRKIDTLQNESKEDDQGEHAE